MPIFVFDPMMQIKWTLILSKIVEVLCKKFFIFKEEEEEEEEEEEKFTRIYKTRYAKIIFSDPIAE
jgi:hypothetical protein